MGVQIQNNGSQEIEINEGISTAMKIHYTLKVLRMKSITKKTKISVYKSILYLILTCCSESWTLTKNIRSRIQAAEIKYL